MKRFIALVSVCVLLLSGCAQESVESSEPTQTMQPTTQPTTQPTQPTETTDMEVMTDVAGSLGITYENYPRIDGSTSTLGIVQEIYRAMYLRDTDVYMEGFPLEASKTVPSYQMLIDGQVDLILVPSASEDVLQTAADAGVTLEFHKVAAEALVFITPVENTAQNITMDQARSIFLDYGITNWQELGGPDRELVPICRNSDSGSQSQMDNLVLNNEPMHEDIVNNHVELTMQGMLEQVVYYHYGGLEQKDTTNTYALGYTLYTYLEDSYIETALKMLSFDGVAPSRESIIDGSYPLTDGYYAVVRSDLPQDHSARAVIRWLQSEEGTAAMERVGLIPCPNET